MISTSARTRGSAGIVVGQGTWLRQRWVLGCNGDGCLAVMEHEAGIEQVTGYRLKSGRRYGSGHESGFGY